MPRQKKRYTIVDIAKEVGVSTTTISRYLAGQYYYMSKETKEKIRLAIIKYNYRPNQLARGLQSNKSGLIGVVIHQVQRPFLSYTLQSVCIGCSETRYSPIFVSAEDNPVREKEKVQSLIDHRVEGILCFTGNSESYYSHLVHEGTPVIFVDRYNLESGLDGVYINHYEAVQEALLSLYVSGCRKIALFHCVENITDTNSTIGIRERSYYDFTKQYKIFEPDLTYNISMDDIKSIESALFQFMKNHTDKKRAVFVPSMSILPVIDNICKLIGIRYPDDIALLGYAIKGDVSLISSEVTTITQPIGQMAKLAINLLDERINEDKSSPFIPQRIKVPAELEIRKSTLFSS